MTDTKLNSPTPIRTCLATALFVLLSVVADVHAQPVNRYIRFEAPAPSLAYDGSRLMGSTPRIAILRSEQSIAALENGERLVGDAVRAWEFFLLGLRIPYEMVEDGDLNRRVSDSYRVLVLPAAEALSVRQRNEIQAFIQRGGGIIASGRTGYYDERGSQLGAEYMETLFGADYDPELPPQPHGIYQTVETTHAVARGVDPGFRLNVRLDQDMSAMRAVSSLAMGRIVTFEAADQEHFDNYTLVLLGDNPGKRFLWTRFQPQDVARDADQQLSYQRLMINALAYVSRSVSVSIAAWPFASGSAVSVAALPSPGFDPVSYYTNMTQFMDMVDHADVAVSYFLASDELTVFPELRRRMIESGSEIGLLSDSDHLMAGQNLEVQRERLDRAVQALGLNRAHGVYPPGGLLDTNTIRALDSAGAAYVLQFGQASFAPKPLNWWDYADFEDSFVIPPPGDRNTSGPSALRRSGRPTKGSRSSTGLRRPSSRSFGRQTDPTPTEEARYLPDIDILPVTDMAGGSLLETFDRIHEAGGYYVLPVRVERYRPYLKEAEELESVLYTARDEGAWLATATEVALWWRRRQNIRPTIESDSALEIRVQLEKAIPDTLEGVVLDLYLPGVPQENLNVSESDSALEWFGDKFRETVRVLVPPLTAGKTHITFTWVRER